MRTYDMSVAADLNKIIGGLTNTRPVLPKFSRALANVRAGYSDTTVYIVGSSSGAGAGAGTSTVGLAGARAKNWPTLWAKFLRDAGIRAYDAAVLGDATGGNIAYGTYDTRATPGAGWAPTSTGTAGGFFNNATTTNPFPFAPPFACDTVDVYTIDAGGSGTMTVSVDGGATLQTITLTGGSTVTKTTVALGSNALHSIELKRVSGTSRFVGVVAYSSVTPMVRLINGSLYGSASGAAADASNPWRPLSFMQSLAPSLVIDTVGLNDAISGVAISTFKANKQAIWDAARISGDVMAVGLQSVSAGTLSDATLQTYNDAIRDLADLNGVPYVDLRLWIGPYDPANALGDYYDGFHSSAQGYAANFATPITKETLSLI